MTANKQKLICPKCKWPIPDDRLNSGGDPVGCLYCAVPSVVYAFPALYASKNSAQQALAAAGSESSCFFHSDKKAEEVCEDCGRFLCPDCCLTFDDVHLCSGCLELRRSGTEMNSFKSKQMRYDMLALGCVLLSFVLVFVAWFTVIGPAVVALYGVYLAFRRWGEKPLLARGYRTRMVLAILLGIVAAVGSTGFSILIFYGLING